MHGYRRIEAHKSRILAGNPRRSKICNIYYDRHSSNRQVKYVSVPNQYTLYITPKESVPFLIIQVQLLNTKITKDEIAITTCPLVTPAVGGWWLWQSTMNIWPTYLADSSETCLGISLFTQDSYWSGSSYLVVLGWNLPTSLASTIYDAVNTKNRPSDNIIHFFSFITVISSVIRTGAIRLWMPSAHILHIAGIWAPLGFLDSSGRYDMPLAMGSMSTFKAKHSRAIHKNMCFETSSRSLD